ncbi:MAG TPA: hypothetical protein VMV80_00800 [Anaerolineales bacterium]|nr:hypothetical protein [Anaerolineales bacterium]
MNIIRNTLIVSLLVVLVLPTSFAFAAGIEDVKGVNYAHCASNEFVQTNSVGFSGDDLYDSAASLSGSEVAISVQCAVASADIIFFSANPELSAAQRYAVAAPVSAEINSFSANPELSVAQLYAVAATASAEINAFSANPELSVAQRYAVAAPVSAETNTFSANPELSVAQRYAAEGLSGSFSGDDDYDLAAGALL